MRPLLPVVFAAMLLLAGCVAPLQTDGGVSAASSEADSETPPSISVSGTGTASADADLALVSVSVTALESDAETARSRVAEDSRAVFEALTDVGVDTDEAVTTTSFRISPEYDFREGGRELLGYRAVHAYQIEVAPEQAGAVVDAAVGAVSDNDDGEGGIVVDGVQYTLTEETRAEVRAEALEKAVDAARADADTVAAATGVSLAGVRTVSVGADFDPSPQPRFAAESADSTATVLQPGPVEVSATVTITYDVE